MLLGDITSQSIDFEEEIVGPRDLLINNGSYVQRSEKDQQHPDLLETSGPNLKPSGFSS